MHTGMRAPTITWPHVQQQLNARLQRHKTGVLLSKTACSCSRRLVRRGVQRLVPLCTGAGSNQSNSSSSTTSVNNGEQQQVQQAQSLANATSKTISSLDALLGIPPEDPKPESPVRAAASPAPSSAVSSSSSSQASEDETGWWSTPPKQRGPPRKLGMRSGDEGKYLEPTDFFTQSGREARVGAPSDAGEELNIPTVPPRLTYVLLGANLAVYGWGVYLALTQGPDASNDYFLDLAKDNSAVLAGEYYRLLSSTFLHAGLLHLGLNCYALWALGTELESVMGYAPFAAIYMLSGLSGAVLSFMLSDDVTVGASGAIFGLLGALAAYFVRNRGIRDSGRQLLFVFLLVGFNLALGTGEDGLIDNTGHIAGFVAGGWLGWGLGPKYVVLSELDIPDGSMVVPKDAKEVKVVVDQNTDLQRWSVTLSFILSLGLALAAGFAARTQGL